MTHPKHFLKREKPLLCVFPKMTLKPFFRGVTRSSVLGGGVEDEFLRAQK